MKLHTAVLRHYRIIPGHGGRKGFLCGTLHSLIGSFHAFLSGHIIFIRHVACQISRLEGDCLRKIKGLNGFHQIVRHLGRAIHRYLVKTNAAASVYHIMAGFRIIIIAVAPDSGCCRTKTDTGIRICIKEPEGHIDSLDFINMVLILKNLRKQAFSLQVLFQPRLCCFLVQLKRNHIIRTQIAGKLSHYHDGIPAKRAGRCRQRIIAHDFSSAGLTHIGMKPGLLSFLPLASCSGIPAHIFFRFTIQFFVIPLQRLHLKFCVAERTLHFLEHTVERNGSAAAWAFIFL